MRKPQVSIKALADGEVELSIYGDIGDVSWDDGAVSAKDVVELLRAHKDATQITVRLNSPGGDAFDGSAIYSRLHQHPARVVVHIDGIAASAAATIAMAGDEIHIAENALFMIHEAWGLAVGGADDLRSTAECLDRINTTIASVYAARSGKSVEEVIDLMAKETWFTGAEAVEAGFADHMTEAKRIAASLSPKWAERYRNAPSSLLAQTVRDSVEDAFEAAGFPVKAIPWRHSLKSEHIPADVLASANRPDAADHSTEDRHEMNENIIQALNLPKGATEADVVAAIGKLQTRASLATELEALIGAKGSEALGAMRAMAQKAQERDEFASELAEVKGTKVRDEFSALLKGAQEGNEKKLTPAMAKYWQERFDRPAADEKLTATQRNEKRSEVRAELEGYLKVASPVVPKNLEQPAGQTGSAGSALTHEGKAFEELKPMERHVLKENDPEQYNLMRNDALRRGVL